MSPQFFFVQTIVAVVILNGMLFTGPLTEKLIDGVSEKRVKPLEEKWVTIAHVSGVLTFSSWTTIVYLSFTHAFHFSYGTLMVSFLVKLALVFIAYIVLEYLLETPLSIVNTN